MLKVIRQSNFQSVSRTDFEQSLTILVESINQLMKDVEELKVFLKDTKNYVTKEEFNKLFTYLDKRLLKPNVTIAKGTIGGYDVTKPIWKMKKSNTKSPQKKSKKTT